MVLKSSFDWWSGVLRKRRLQVVELSSENEMLKMLLKLRC